MKRDRKEDDSKREVPDHLLKGSGKIRKERMVNLSYSRGFQVRRRVFVDLPLNSLEQDRSHNRV